MPRRYTGGMNIDLSGSESELLKEVLDHELGTLRQQVYHAEAPRFKDELKERQRALEGLINKLH